MPRVLRVDPDRPDPALIAEAARSLCEGELVAFPTETVYGLGARGLHAAETSAIFRAKGRPAGHPVILHVDGLAMARTVGAFTPLAERFAEAFWPGPLTLVVPRMPHVPDVVTGGLDTVGIRAPAHPVALALIRAVGEPLAAPSANAHTHVSPTRAEHVVASLGDRVALVLDAGPAARGIESTVVSLGDPPLVLRPGAVTVEALAAIAPGVREASATIEGDAPRASPGQAAKHYAPRAAVVLVPRGASLRDVRVRGAALAPGQAAAIVATPAAREAAAGAQPLLVLPDDPEGYARGLYAALHAVDAAGAHAVVVEDVPRGDPAWRAVADRLTRAARG